MTKQNRIVGGVSTSLPDISKRNLTPETEFDLIKDVNKILGLLNNSDGVFSEKLEGIQQQLHVISQDVNVALWASEGK